MSTQDPRAKRSEELNESELDSVAGGFPGQPHHWGDTDPGAPVFDDPNAAPANPDDKNPDDGSIPGEKEDGRA